ncbi:nucleotide-diphospho-sugar transferase [Roridomyces roridus]|uniref:Nucleotide-diphospho-sugar transferase n=1 Tax=Roridomyces roridus TaxID=1738132 RepID=A0AAD7BP78_9AGAR|nr:nucleotide-diphospho-sugar transferase [Roridomyces roridus]
MPQAQHPHPVVLPTPPSDAEKYSYLSGRRFVLHCFGVLAFLSLHLGAWLFALSSSEFLWFLPFVVVVQLYHLLWSAIDFTGRDFDFSDHKETLRNYAVSTENEPSVDIFLPCCNESLEILENTYTYIAQLDYTNLRIWVLDDSARPAVAALAQQGRFGFNYIQRPNRLLGKAGNRRFAFAQTSAEFFAVFDTDMCPRPEFLKEVVPVMRRYAEAAIVQTPQYFRVCGEQTWAERGAGPQVEVPFRVDQVNRDRLGATACVGSNALYRREALKDVGGAFPIAYSEDEHTGFQTIKRGWQVKYLPLPMVCGTCPDSAQVYFSQQVRWWQWCATAPTLVLQRDFWDAKLGIMQRLCWVAPLFGYIPNALFPFLWPLPALLLTWLKPDLVRWYWWGLVAPTIFNSHVVRSLWSRQVYVFLSYHQTQCIQRYTHLTSLADQLFGTVSGWVASGHTNSVNLPSDTGVQVDVDDENTPLIGDVATNSKSTISKYDRMRVLCAVWVYGTTAALVVGVSEQARSGYGLVEFVPGLLCATYEIWRTWAFIWWA